jgi:hypothetical protein
VTSGLAHLVAALAIVVAGLGCRPRDEAPGLDCVFDPRAPVTECTHVTGRQDEVASTLSESAELVLESLTASRSAVGVVVDARLAGRFWNETDQNVYVFLGAAGGEARYALSADPGYAADVGYPVRGEVTVPHTIDVRVGIMAPVAGGYSPQVYVDDPVRALAVGEGAIGALRVTRQEIHAEIPLERWYVAKRVPVPEHLGVTVATARDYVGFVDQLSVRELPVGSSGAAAGRDAPPMTYPKLDLRSHHFERVAMQASPSGGVTVELEMGAPITDWGQTNLHVFFLPVPLYPSAKPLLDPSKSRTLPAKWSFYCGVYSPRRVFCKPSAGRDFTFDSAYAERATLAAPEGVTFRELGGARYALDVGAQQVDTLRAGRSTFALVVSAGRDGFGPTTWYGSAAAGQR